MVGWVINDSQWIVVSNFWLMIPFFWTGFQFHRSTKHLVLDAFMWHVWLLWEVFFWCRLTDSLWLLCEFIYLLLLCTVVCCNFAKRPLVITVVHYKLKICGIITCTYAAMETLEGNCTQKNDVFLSKSFKSMENRFSNVFFTCCASWFFRRFLNIAILQILPLNTAAHNCWVSGCFKSLWCSIRGREIVVWSKPNSA